MRCIHKFKGICRHIGNQCTYFGDTVIHCDKYEQNSRSMCKRDAKLSGLCSKHYDKELRHGRIVEPDIDSMMFGPPEDRWWDEFKDIKDAS